MLPLSSAGTCLYRRVLAILMPSGKDQSVREANGRQAIAGFLIVTVTEARNTGYSQHHSPAGAAIL